MNERSKGDFEMDAKRIVRALGLCACALVLSACMTVGKEFAVDKVGQIQIGKTTRDEIQQMFGDPWRTGLEDGRRTWTYGHYKYSLFGPAQTRDLVIRYDPKGIVASYTFNAAPPLEGSL